MNKKSKKSKKSGGKKRRETLKNKSGGLRSCDNFCKKDFSPEIEKQFIKFAKENKVPYKPTKDLRDFRIAACKQNFCNEGCKGFKFFSEEQEKEFNKKINGNYLKRTKRKIIEKLNSKGAISYCGKSEYDPFHT